MKMMMITLGILTKIENLYMLTSITIVIEKSNSKMNLDLNAYSGKWYEVGKNNAYFETQCQRSTADYVAGPRGLDVLNTCYLPNGKKTTIRGFATPTNNPSVFDLRFDTGQTGKYQILFTDYTNFSIVGDVATQYVSVLSRKKNISDAEKSLLEEILRLLGFSKVEWI